MTLLFLVVAITIATSATCSLIEAVLYSSRLTTLESARSGNRHRSSASRFIAMKQKIARPIAAILILNTIANTAGATIAGMYAASSLGPEYVPAFSAALTAGILIFSEILPKTLGAAQWRFLWPFVVLPLQVMQYSLYPFIWLSQKLTGLITSKDTAHITEDEILALVKLGASAGEISQEESRMVRNIIGLDRIPVKRIMTPRNVMFVLGADTTIDEALPEFYAHGFSRAPIYEKDREHITGYVLVQDLLNPAIMDQSHQSLHGFKKRISFYPETANCLTILTEFIKKKRQIGIISDEFGGVAGLVTLEDLMETILGKEIVDERDTVDDMQKIARKKFSRHGPS